MYGCAIHICYMGQRVGEVAVTGVLNLKWVMGELLVGSGCSPSIVSRRASDLPANG